MSEPTWEQLGGAQGVQGPVGPQGPLGPQGPKGVDGDSFGYIGAYVAGPTYEPGDIVVASDGIAYVNVKQATTPPESWNGITGPAGPPGPQGTQGPQGVKGDTGTAGTGLPTVQNGRWLTGVGGAAVWAPIIETDVRGLVVADTGWNTLPLVSPFVAYSSGSSVFHIPQYRKLASGLVVFRGLLSCTSAPAAASTIATLPVGYRCVKQDLFGVINNGGVSRLDIEAATGRLYFNNSFTGDAVSWFSIANVSWYADA